MTAFGPQLIGETEKTLGAVLARLLGGVGLSEREWVTLRLAGQLSDSADLVAQVADRAHFADAAALVAALVDRGLVDEGGLTAAGRTLLDGVQARIVETTAPIWSGLPDADVAAAERVLNLVVARSRELLVG